MAISDSDTIEAAHLNTVFDSSDSGSPMYLLAQENRKDAGIFQLNFYTQENTSGTAGLPKDTTETFRFVAPSNMNIVAFGLTWWNVTDAGAGTGTATAELVGFLPSENDLPVPPHMFLTNPISVTATLDTSVTTEQHATRIFPEYIASGDIGKKLTEKDNISPSDELDLAVMGSKDPRNVLLYGVEYEVKLSWTTSITVTSGADQMHAFILCQCYRESR